MAENQTVGQGETRGNQMGNNNYFSELLSKPGSWIEWAKESILGKRKREDSAPEVSPETPVPSNEIERNSNLAQEEERGVANIESPSTPTAGSKVGRPNQSNPPRLGQTTKKTTRQDLLRGELAALGPQINQDVLWPRAHRRMRFSEGELEENGEENDRRLREGEENYVDDGDLDDSEVDDIGEDSSDSSSYSQPQSKRVKITSSHTAEHDVQLPNSYPQVLDGILAENTQILVKMPKYNLQNLPQRYSEIDHEDWSKYPVPRLVSTQEVVMGPVPTLEHLIGKITLDQEVSKVLHASYTPDPKPGHGVKSIGHKVEKGEFFLKWAQSLLGDLPGPPERPNNQLDSHTIDFYQKNALSGWQIEGGSSAILVVTAETIWFFAPLTESNRSIFQNHTDRGSDTFSRLIKKLKGTIMVTQAPSQEIWIPTGTLYCNFALNSHASYGIRGYFANQISLHGLALTAIWPELTDRQKDLRAECYLSILQLALGDKKCIYSAVSGICDGQFVKLVKEEKERFRPAYHLFQERFNKPQGFWEPNKECPCGKEQRNPFKMTEKTIKHILAVHISELNV
ncbi:hypothetical protein NHQ30_004338 [Ciborinia camelliae]|nr:hypothetical protein NHQ30_004338 [Ciborinia camelliae]